MRFVFPPAAPSVLIIRDSQIAAFEAEMRRSFERRAAEHLARLPGCAVGPEQAGPLVARGIARAAAYGIVAERDVVLFLELMARLGEDFDERPGLAWARALLASAALTPSARMQRVFDAAVRSAAEGGRGGDE